MDNALTSDEDAIPSKQDAVPSTWEAMPSTLYAVPASEETQKLIEHAIAEFKQKLAGK